MALLNKLGNLMENVAGKTVEIAEAAADKTQSLAEMARLNGRISEENSRILALKVNIGNAIYGRYERGETVDAELADYCRLIEGCLGSIAELQAEIARIKGEPARTQAGAEPVAVVCPGCGKPQAPGSRFCQACGARLDSAPEAPQEEEEPGE